MAAPIYRGGQPFISSALRTRLPIVASSGATQTINPGQSNSWFLLDRATLTYTLPTPKKGMTFGFAVTTAATTQKLVTATIASQFFIGGIWLGVAAGTGTEFWGDGSTLVSVNFNGTTTGGLVGSYFTVTAVSTTLWLVEGVVEGSGTVATPFATS